MAFHYPLQNEHQFIYTLVLMQTLELSPVLEQKMTGSLIRSLEIASLSLPSLERKINDFIKTSHVMESSKPFYFSDYQENQQGSLEKQTLSDFLLRQIDSLYLSDKNNAVLAMMVDDLNSHGHFRDYVGLRKRLMEQYRCRSGKIVCYLGIIQGLEPYGVGARNVKESLLLQLEHYSLDDSAFESLVRSCIADHLEDVGHKEDALIAKRLGVKENEIENVRHFIVHHLEPNPCHDFDVTATRWIRPSFAVTDQGGVPQVTNLEAEWLPTLKINDDAKQLLSKESLSAERKQELSRELYLAQQFLDALAFRRKVLNETIQEIICKQYSNLKKGIASLQPYLQKDVAHSLGYHPSTISRMVVNKFVQTPQGVIPLKTFFPRTYKKRFYTANRLKEMIYNLIQLESSPLSDEKIRQHLDEQGVVVTRRLVNYYRDELGYQTFRTRGTT